MVLSRYQGLAGLHVSETMLAQYSNRHAFPLFGDGMLEGLLLYDCAVQSSWANEEQLSIVAVATSRTARKQCMI